MSRITVFFAGIGRWALVALALALLAGQVVGAERIVEAASGRELSRDELLARLRGAERVLLGERHDNGRHHELRGELIAALGKTRVVAEQLERGHGCDFSTACAGSAGGVAEILKHAGFNDKAWPWPLYRPLFAAVADSGGVLAGGNIPRELARRIARDGRPAIPAELLAALDAAPLSGAATERLDTDLIRGHCGEVDPGRLAGLRLAQRTRDAAMAAAMAELPPPEPGRPHILLAGNGHVRLDYGVPTLLGAGRPGLLVVGFAETGQEVADARRDGLYHIIWLTAPADRTDPCLALRRPAGAPQ